MKIESDYEPVDISAQCNTGVEVLPSQNEPGPATPSAEPTGPHEDSQDSQAQTVAGLRTLRGLPFLIGPSDEIDELRCFVRLRGGDDVLLFVAVSLLLVAFSCGSPTPVWDEPRFAEGEATAILLAYLRQRGACGWDYQLPSDYAELYDLPRGRQYYWSYEEASFNERYDGHGKWKVSTAIPAYMTGPTVRPDWDPLGLAIYEGRSKPAPELLLVRKAIPDASWNVYENTATVLRLTAPKEC